MTTSVLSNETMVNSMNNTFSTQRVAQPSIFNLYGSFNNVKHEKISVEDAIQQAQADFNVSKKMIVAFTEEQLSLLCAGETITDFNPNNIIYSCRATTRDDNENVLGIVSANYGVVQNSKAFEFINFIDEASNGNFTIETAGVLGRGEKIYVSCKLGEDCYLDDNGKDKVNMYVVFTNSHDGSGAVQVFFTPTRVICQNTLNFALKHAQNKLSFRHSKYVNERLDWKNDENRANAYELFSKSVQFSNEFTANMLFLRSQQVNETQVKDFVAKVILNDETFDLYIKANRNIDMVDEIKKTTKNKISQLRASIENGIGQDQHRGTRLWLINGLTTFYQNDKIWESEESKLKNILNGETSKQVQTAYKYLMEA